MAMTDDDEDHTPSLTAPNGHFRRRAAARPYTTGRWKTCPRRSRSRPRKRRRGCIPTATSYFPPCWTPAEVAGPARPDGREGRAGRRQVGRPELVLQPPSSHGLLAGPAPADLSLTVPASLTSSGPSTIRARMSPAAAFGRRARAARWASTLDYLPIRLPEIVHAGPRRARARSSPLRRISTSTT